MTEQEESFVHLVSCIRDLHNAWRLLQEIRRCRSKSLLVGAAFRFALIEYSKPFKASVGTVLDSKGKAKRYKLDDRHIPPAQCDLHSELLARRDQLHAHSDLTVREARIYVSRTTNSTMAQVSENVIYGTEDLVRLEEIISLVEGTLDNLYKEEQRLESLIATS